MSHTYAILSLSPAAYAEIREKLVAAGYEDQLHEQGGAECIEMHGIAVQSAPGNRSCITVDEMREHVSRAVAEAAKGFGMAMGEDDVKVQVDPHDSSRVNFTLSGAAALLGMRAGFGAIEEDEETDDARK